MPLPAPDACEEANLEIAIPTSVVIMAWTSLVGTATLFTTGWLSPDLWTPDPELLGSWLAAAPVVASEWPL